MKKNLLYIIPAVILLGIFISRQMGWFSNTSHYKVIFPEVSGLVIGSDVLVQGVRVGKVHAIKIVNQNAIESDLTVNKSLVLYKGATARLVTVNTVAGTKNIILDPGKGKEILTEGALLTGLVDSSTLEPGSKRLESFLDNFKYLLTSADTGLRNVHTIIKGQLTKKAMVTLVSLDQQTKKLAVQAQAFNNNSVSLTAGLRQFDSATAKWVKGQDKFNQALNNIADNSTKLASQDLVAQVNGITKSLNKLKIPQFPDKKDSGYQQTLKNLNSIKKSMQELKSNPQGIHLFGKKKIVRTE